MHFMFALGSGDPFRNTVDTVKDPALDIQVHIWKVEPLSHPVEGVVNPIMSHGLVTMTKPKRLFLQLQREADSFFFIYSINFRGSVVQNSIS